MIYDIYTKSTAITTLNGENLNAITQYLGQGIADSLEKTLMLEKIEGRGRREEGDREWDGWKTSLTQWTWIWANSGK